MFRRVLLIITSFSFLFSPITTLAFNIGNEFLLQNGTPVNSKFGSLGSLISTILPNIFIISGLILLFLLIFGGFTIITSSGDPKQADQGKQTITGAIIGFVIIFISYWIVQIIQIITGVPILNPPNNI
jgi:hypothetical protein